MLLTGRQANANLDKAARQKRRRELEKQARIAVDQSLCFFCLWLVVLRPAAAGPKAPVASHEAQIPATRAAPRLRSAASASCAAQVDGGTNPLMFSQARAPATRAGRRR